MIISILTAALPEKDPSFGTKNRAADENATRPNNRSSDRSAQSTLHCKGSAVNIPRAARVFKVAERAAWLEACGIGTFTGSADDVRDGFIHLSALDQLNGTLARHFKGKSDLVLIAFESSELGKDLKWEASRNGELFPHLHASLPTSAARAVHALGIDENGVPVLPADL
jgi:uncharacterized protein (DUF952 family)